MTSLQDAITQAEAYNGLVLIPAQVASRFLTATLNLANLKYDAIEGETERGVQLEWTGSNNLPVIKVAGSEVSSTYSFRKFTIFNQTATGVSGVQIGESSDSHIFLMTDFDTLLLDGVKYGLVLNGCDEASIIRSWFFNNFTGIKLNGSSSNINVLMNYFQGITNAAIDGTVGGSRILALGNTIQGSTPAISGFIFDLTDCMAVISNYYEQTSGNSVGPFVHLGVTALATDNMSGAVVLCNHVDLGTSYAGSIGVKANFVTGAIIGGNSFRSVDKAIQVTANAKNTLILPNSYGSNINAKLEDCGVNTIMLDPALGPLYMPNLRLPKQPSFIAKCNSSKNSVTGDGTAYSVVFDNNVVDRNSSHSSGIFTAPIDGLYRFSASVYLTGVDASHTAGRLDIVSTQYSYVLANLNVGVCRTSANQITLSGTAFVEMAAGETAKAVLTVSGGSKTINVLGDATAIMLSHFGGDLVC